MEVLIVVEVVVVVVVIVVLLKGSESGMISLLHHSATPLLHLLHTTPATPTTPLHHDYSSNTSPCLF